ncbi:36007_t:CDS:1, partial [Racocetra persica]
AKETINGIPQVIKLYDKSSSSGNNVLLRELGFSFTLNKKTKAIGNSVLIRASYKSLSDE